jgi:hypothetical protein
MNHFTDKILDPNCVHCIPTGMSATGAGRPLWFDLLSWAVVAIVLWRMTVWNIRANQRRAL